MEGISGGSGKGRLFALWRKGQSLDETTLGRREERKHAWSTCFERSRISRPVPRDAIAAAAAHSKGRQHILAPISAKNPARRRKHSMSVYNTRPINTGTSLQRWWYRKYNFWIPLASEDARRSVKSWISLACSWTWKFPGAQISENFNHQSYFRAIIYLQL